VPESVHTASSTAARQAPRLVLIQPSWLARNFWLLRRAFVAAYEDNCFGIAKGAAYSFFLSLFPILTTLTAILIHVNAQSVVHVIAEAAREIVPPGTEEIILSRLREKATKPVTVPLLATILSLWAGSGAMMSLMEGFQAAYRIPTGRPFLKQRSMAIFLVLIAALPAVGASSLIIFGNRIETAIVNGIGLAELSGPFEFLWRLVRYILAFSTTVFVTGLLYFFGPNHRSEPDQVRITIGSRFWRVWPGAFIATVFWMLATAGFAWYVHHLANYNIFYGSIYTVIVLIIWLYLVACVALLGCEFNAERERIYCLPVAD
jgi:membrane protein